MTDKSPVLLSAYVVLLIAVIYAPVMLIPLFSLNDAIYVTLPLKGLTFEWYQQLAGNQKMLEALSNSLGLAVASSVVSTALATLTALGLRQQPFRGQYGLVGIIVLPLVIPPVVLGVALIGILRNYFHLPASLTSIAIGHILLCLPFAFLTVATRLQAIDKNFEEASRDLGEGALATFLRVTLPLALPAIISSLLLCFTISFDEFVLAFFLGGNEPTLPVFIFSQLRFPNRLPSVLALGTCILTVSFLMLLTSAWASRSSYPTTSRGPDDQLSQL
ncbi:MAG: ABC transporter permease [Mesorhizobium sp.]|uniref:ABC transporter permease n=1 Tax=Mesorhizobium sp. TaxID=1871066 RepID=UPI000FE7800B|nr:ABC transporter permease [Mesorhizobium sp.]RWB32259.1 MAG: ABC transporter permease [Mesorhizobium sp.]RWF78303.1 MAG: ABC transporter permease [Mesorhizobium sp.]